MKNKIIFNILTVISYFYGVLLCASLVLIPVGVYSIIAANRFSDFANKSDFQLSQCKQSLKNWVIFGSILYFPFGLIGLISLYGILNNVKVSDVEQTEHTTDDNSEQKNTVTEVEIDNPTTQAQKQETRDKLKRFMDNGLISEEEYNQAMAQLDKD